ncbi:succinylglutamate desuccinylase/aspartoacylase family protein [uncultured Abyssibacter sp.]|uniref:succinylglutamate desuccinylase/aspartoacylase family protein n=1 Tax=uncultured Abyssibacter sp. TaxID=2320202 RepID=UPI0032B18757
MSNRLAIVVITAALGVMGFPADAQPPTPPDDNVAGQVAPPDSAEQPAAPAESAASPTPEDTAEDTSVPAPEPEPEGVQPFPLLGQEVQPGTWRQLAWTASYHFGQLGGATPVLVSHGANPGPVLCLTGAVHGDELNGIEIIRRVVHSLDPKTLSGTVIGVPIVNLAGFQRNSRYLPDRRDLNRYFPGSPTGSLASRVAQSFFTEVIEHCDQLADLHTGSFHRTNLPQLRADLTKPEVVELSRGFGGIAVLHTEGAKGTLRRAAVDAGIPAVTLEAGEPLRLEPSQVDQGVRGIETLMHQLGMIERERRWSTPQPVFYESYWVRSDHGGILLTLVRVGDVVSEGTVMGTVTDPLTNVRHEIRSPYRGRVLGMALNQVVMPGFAAFRIGIQTTEEAVQEEAAREVPDPEVDATTDVEKKDDASEIERPPPERAEESSPRMDGEDAPEEESEESDGISPQAVPPDEQTAQPEEPVGESEPEVTPETLPSDTPGG